ncbi:hypothetical protein OKW41_006585 [Paraburkholderia sp. UCT70]
MRRRLVLRWSAAPWALPVAVRLCRRGAARGQRMIATAPLNTGQMTHERLFRARRRIQLARAVAVVRHQRVAAVCGIGRARARRTLMADAGGHRTRHARCGSSVSACAGVSVRRAFVAGSLSVCSAPTFNRWRAHSFKRRWEQRIAEEGDRVAHYSRYARRARGARERGRAHRAAAQQRTKAR